LLVREGAERAFADHRVEAGVGLPPLDRTPVYAAS
jgi:hypothetical protein